MKLDNPLTLPCGKVLPNRIAKSALSENMAKKGHIPGIEFYNAYSTWAEGGTGLCISGNIMIDSQHRGEAHNVVIERGLNNHTALKKWSKVSQENSMHIWLQLNHPGKQTPKFLTQTPLAPSSIALTPPLNNIFNHPRELTHEEILDIINRFSHAALVAKECGFQGVQIHGAHGYLVSQFLSPHHNRRNDKWGGTLEKRMNFVIEIYTAIRTKVGDKFPIGIKLNSADFSKGGFSHEDSIAVAKRLSDLGIDLIEVSGGSYERPVMTGLKIKDSTKKREAYFLEYAKDIKKNVNCPVMVTGGFRTASLMQKALTSKELDIIGLGRPLCIDPSFTKKILTDSTARCPTPFLTSGVKKLDQLFPLEIIWYTMQIHRIGKNKFPNPRMSAYKAILSTALDTGLQSLKKVRGTN